MKNFAAKNEKGAKERRALFHQRQEAEYAAFLRKNPIIRKPPQPEPDPLDFLLPYPLTTMTREEAVA